MKKISLAGCAFILDGKIILLERTKTGWFELPGGKIEEDETPEDAALREIREELLVEARLVKKLGEKDFTEGEHTMAYHWFQAEALDGQTFAIGEKDKFTSLKAIPLEALTEHRLSPNMQNFVAALRNGEIQLVGKDAELRSETAQSEQHLGENRK
ncbi:MAG: NUDIX hydrolase [uncultured bacterium]|nr:MAG: NUDIX hydrolase [uncultured bacterium]